MPYKGTKTGNDRAETEPSVRSWLWVFLCTAMIFSIIPLARSFQKFIYNFAGKEVFTWFSLAVIISGSSALFYYLIFKLKIRSVPQYLWLSLSSGLYIYFTFELTRHPEEAIHLLVYTLLSFLLFNALRSSIHDITIYITTVLIVMFIGTTDEFIQWIMPGRYWGVEDIKINIIAAAICQLAIWKGIRPNKVSDPISRLSVRLLAGIMTLNLLFTGLCLSNTPERVKQYASSIKFLSWLNYEEPMTEFGYEHHSPDIGILYSRLTIDELKTIDNLKGKQYGSLLSYYLSRGEEMQDMLKIFNPGENSFLHEFLIHYNLRSNHIDQINLSDNGQNSEESINIALKENMLLEKYFGRTLISSGLVLSDNFKNRLINERPSTEKTYVSRAGKIITSFSLGEAWIFIIILLLLIWGSYLLWGKNSEEKNR